MEAVQVAPVTPLYLNYRQAAEYLSGQGMPITKGFLEGLVSRGKGPVSRKFGKYRIFKAADLDAWSEARMVEG